MSLTLSNIGKKYQKDWIFRNINFEFKIPGSYVIKGSNGSGKSSLLQLISGFVTPSEGIQKLKINKTLVELDKWAEHISFAAPYYELLEDMYLEEFIDFFVQFKPLRPGISEEDLIKIAYLEDSKRKQLKNFSSGMKQRLRLVIAWLSDTNILLLDEPISNLDSKGIEWYTFSATRV
jgi:ABC-type multidrug transport system ATPase subunit